MTIIKPTMTPTEAMRWSRDRWRDGHENLRLECTRLSNRCYGLEMVLRRLVNGEPGALDIARGMLPENEAVVCECWSRAKCGWWATYTGPPLEQIPEPCPQCGGEFTRGESAEETRS